MSDKCATLSEESARQAEIDKATAEAVRSEYAEKRLRRALQRWHSGRGLGRLLLITLTTPEGYQGDIHRAWRLFMWRARHKQAFREYYAVKEWNEKHTCRHLHVVFRTRDWIDVVLLRQCWTKAVKASDDETRVLDVNDEGQYLLLGTDGLELDSSVSGVWTYHKWIRTEKGIGSYLGKYLLKAGETDSRRRCFWYGKRWVAEGWTGWSKAMWMAGADTGLAHALLMRQGVTGQIQTDLLIKAMSAQEEQGFLFEKGVVYETLIACKRYLNAVDKGVRIGI